MENHTPLLNCVGLKKDFPVYAGFFRKQIASIKAVDGIDCQIREGEIVGIVGESGCGKSTFGRLAIGLLEPSEGSIQYKGKELSLMSSSEKLAARRKMQIVFQDPYASLNPRKTITENVGEALLYHKMVQNYEERDQKSAAILKLVGLNNEVLYRYPHQFSGGQQQRICIARAIAMNPELIVLDEALSALDVSVQAQIIELLIELRNTLKLTYLMISHDLSVVRYLCDRVIVLYLGKVMESAPTAELFSSPRHPYTKALLSAIPSFHPAKKKERWILKGEIPSARNPPSGCPFRTRCPFAQPICAEPPPRKQGKSPLHHYQCILDEIPPLN